MNILVRTLLFGMILLIVPNSKLSAQNIIYSKTDSLIFENYIEAFCQYQNMPTNELLLKTASFFINKPYVASTLDKLSTEKLVVNLREFDCTTFVESSLALCFTLKSKQHSFANFCNILQKIRYRNGIIEDYSSRLHYVSEWMFEHETDGTLRNISKDIGGHIETKKINFMSLNTKSYHQLLKDKQLQKNIKKTEDQLNKRGGYYVLSKEKICTNENNLKNGDLVIFSTSISGLDFTHMGIITTENVPLSFIHASSGSGKVITEKKGLSVYCNMSKKCNGIVILRLN